MAQLSFKSLWLCVVVLGLAAGARADNCTADFFQYPVLFGAQFTDLQANPVTGFNLTPTTPEGMLIPSTGLNLCNVTIQYFHPGQNDTTNVQVWLPDVWNGRFAGAGGGGFASGVIDGEPLASVVNLGYSSAVTDGGHSQIWDHAPWLLNSQGNYNYPLIFNFASLSIHDMAVIGKSITTQYYGTAPKFSYFDGCSTGGRQAIQSAQTYPEDFDGILAGAPAVNLPALSLSVYWPQSVMDRLDFYPPECELDYIVAQSVSACDELDGVKDGIISLPDQCNFDPYTIVGQTIDDCNGTTITVSKQAAGIANAIWNGPTSINGQPLFVGVNRGTPFTGPLALANTECDTGNTNCTGVPFPMAVDWLQYMVQRDPDYDPKTMTLQQLAGFYTTSTALLDGIIGGNNPDLSQFKSLGKKMISWQGQADECITTRNSRLYYDSVLQFDPNATDYYRHFEAPGVNHCAAQAGVYYPLKAMDALRSWVEGGITPDILTGYQMPNGTTEGLGSESGPTRPICVYPSVLKYNGGNASSYSSFSCTSEPVPPAYPSASPSPTPKDEL